MKHQKTYLQGVGIFFGFGMFIFIALGSDHSKSPFRLTLLAAICTGAGLAFWAIMSVFVKVAGKYMGTERATPDARTKTARAISLLSIPFAAGPIFYTLAYQDEYLWPVLASSAPAFLLMAPLVSRLAQPTEVAIRALASALFGTALGLGLNQYSLTGTPLSAPSYQALALLPISSVSWCVSYILSTYANRRIFVSKT